jgi:ribose 5-phosphate isomerase A
VSTDAAADGTVPLIAQRALEFVQDGQVVGLGSGKASTAFVRALGRRVQAGLRVRGVPTSEATAALARQLGIPLATLDEGFPLDLAVDGADEVDPRLDLIKGLGGALVREKVVAASARRLVILVGPEKVEEKLVAVLGSRGTLPVEVLPFALGLCTRRLLELGLPGGLRADPQTGQPLRTDNGNHILDCRTGPLLDPGGLEARLRAVPGVVGTGLFLGMADTVLIQRGDTVEVRRRSSS